MRSLKTPRSIAHDDRLTMVGHLDQLRTRIIVSLIALAVAFGVSLAEPPLADADRQPVGAPDPAARARRARSAWGDVSGSAERQRHGHAAADGGRGAGGRASRHAGGRGTAEPGAAQSQQRHRAALDAAAGQPAGDARDRRAVHHDGHRQSDLRPDPRAAAAALAGLWVLHSGAGAGAATACQVAGAGGAGLFVAGVAFGYFVVLPAAVQFFQNFNSDQFNVLVQASQYYKFAATTILAMGLLFQVPVAILAITRAGVITPRQTAPQPPLCRRGVRPGRCRAAGATRSRCCSRPCRCTRCLRSASCWPRSRTAAREGSRPRPRHPRAPDPIAAPPPKQLTQGGGGQRSLASVATLNSVGRAAT